MPQLCTRRVTLTDRQRLSDVCSLRVLPTQNLEVPDADFLTAAQLKTARELKLHMIASQKVLKLEWRSDFSNTSSIFQRSLSECKLSCILLINVVDGRELSAAWNLLCGTDGRGNLSLATNNGSVAKRY